MSLRLNIIDALYSAIDAGYEDELVNMTPRMIAEDMQGHDVFDDSEFEQAVVILQGLRLKGDI